MVSDKQLRCQSANDLLKCIASCGRKFFAYQNKIAEFQIDKHGKIWIIDEYTNERIYVHYKGVWRNFSGGGTLRNLVIRLRDFIQSGVKMPQLILGPWPEWYCNGDLWGYGKSMEIVRDKAKELKMI